jgi:hypothetical protein
MSLEERVMSHGHDAHDDHGHGGHDDHGHDAHPADPVKEYVTRQEHLSKLLRVTREGHTKAYLAVSTKHDLANNPYKLKDEKTRKAVAKDLVKEYEKMYEAATGTKLPDDWAYKNRFMNMVWGVTEDSLLHHINEAGENYSLDTHEQIRDAHLKKVQEELVPIVYQPITENLDDEKKRKSIFKAMGLEDILERSKPKTGQEAAQHMIEYLHKTDSGRAHYSTLREKYMGGGHDDHGHGGGHH